ncbi:viral A-type inclusion protein, partial [Clostridium botulinum]|nr:viral A-type inclusion protein [Clostridium botulinum]NFP05807.1 viral A-type inclusion protein [Clostridium botulinum]
YGDISETANRIQYVTTYNGDLRRFIRRYFNGNWETKELATTETAEIGLLNGWEKDYGELKITKTGGVCYLNFQGTVGVSSVGTTIFNIPEGFRPKYQQVFYIPQRDGKPFFGVAIDTNGNVDISGVTSLPTQGAKTDFYMMWRVD